MLIQLLHTPITYRGTAQLPRWPSTGGLRQGTGCGPLSVGGGAPTHSDSRALSALDRTSELVRHDVEERRAKQFLDHLKRCCCREDRPPLKPQRQKYSLDLCFQSFAAGWHSHDPTLTESVRNPC